MNNIITSLKLITIFKNILKDTTISCYIKAISALKGNNFDEFLQIYSEFISHLYEKEEHQDIQKYLKKLIYTDKNIISTTKNISNKIIETADYELTLFDKLLSYDYTKIKELANINFPEDFEIIEHLAIFNTEEQIKFNINALIKSYKDNGYGDFACYNAFKFSENKAIEPVKYFSPRTFSQLKNYEYQKSVIYNNTKAFLEGKEANNILLYGDRGCGKSSTVKALVNEFSNYNLKIIQITKESFLYLDDLYEKLRNLPLKFIIFADDISFEENDKDFSKIKALLEGSLENRPENTIIYTTTNRMHLVKESFSAREGNEIHYNDTIDEMVSLSDRFGIMLTFSRLTKNEYIDIVKKIAVDCCIEVNDELLRKSEQFSALKGIRTPRIARQFIIDFQANKN